MNNALVPILWVMVALPILILLQRWIHRHLHGVAYLVTGNKNWAVVLYAIILLPGVLLHELSHWLTAQILGVRTGSLSILPKRTRDGAIQLGYVEYYKTRNVGPIRESLIGSAPLITGTAVILLIAYNVLDLNSLVESLQSGDVAILSRALTLLFETGDFLVWLYLLFAISNAMMPSASDRRAWPAFLLLLAILTIVLYLIGVADDVVSGLAGPVATVFGYLAMAFSLTIGVDLFFMLLIHSVEWLISRIKGVDVVYGQSPTQPS